MLVYFLCMFSFRTWPSRLSSVILPINEESIVNVSDNEILYDKDGNIIGEEDVAEGLKEIMEYHMNKLSKRLDVFAALASTEDKDKDKETRGEME